jgi:GNAT superfamily N-acetyltransferase
MSVRTLCKEDWELLKQLFIRMTAETPTAFSGTLADLEKQTDQEWQTLATNIEASPNMDGLFIESDSEACGFVTAAILTKQRLARFEGQPEEESAELSDTTILGRMWVQAEIRGQGIAQSLIQSVLDWAQAKQQRRVLLAVTDGNERARRCYVSAGFVPTGFSMPHPSYPELTIHWMDFVFEIPQSSESR